MNDFDRGIIKWQPFESVTSTKSMIREINKEKSKIKHPLLSEEQINEIEQNLLLAFYEQNEIEIFYYKTGSIIKVKSNIKKIDSIHHKIYLKNITLLFEQIVRIII